MAASLGKQPASIRNSPRHCLPPASRRPACIGSDRNRAPYQDAVLRAWHDGATLGRVGSERFLNEAGIGHRARAGAISLRKARHPWLGCADEPVLGVIGQLRPDPPRIRARRSTDLAARGSRPSWRLATMKPPPVQLQGGECLRRPRRNAAGRKAQMPIRELARPTPAACGLSANGLNDAPAGLRPIWKSPWPPAPMPLREAAPSPDAPRSSPCRRGPRCGGRTRPTIRQNLAGLLSTI